MDVNVPLIDYLQWTPQEVPRAKHITPGPNTRGRAYSHEDIHHVSAWTDFNLDAILQRYGDLLHRATIPADPVPLSPPHEIISTDDLRTRIIQWMHPRVRRSLRAGFKCLAEINQLHGMTVTSIMEGDYGVTIGAHESDFAYHLRRILFGLRTGVPLVISRIVPSLNSTLILP